MISKLNEEDLKKITLEEITKQYELSQELSKNKEYETICTNNKQIIEKALKNLIKIRIIKTIPVNVNKANKKSSTLKVTIPKEIKEYKNLNEGDIVEYQVLDIFGETLINIDKSKNLKDLI